MARPSKFNQKLADEICRRIASGESLRSVCRDDKMPALSTVVLWITQLDKKEFSAQYERACDARAEHMFEELLEIADDGSNDWMEKKYGDSDESTWVQNGETMQRSRLRVDTRKWWLSKMRPKKYGDSVTHKGDPENPVSVAFVSLHDAEGTNTHA